MLRSIVKILGTLAFTLTLSLAVLTTSSVNVAFAASQPSQGNPQAALASVNPPIVSDASGQGVCLPNGYNLNGWRCGWRLALAPYNLGGYASPYYYGGYYSPAYGTGGYNYAPSYYYYMYNPYSYAYKLVRVGNRWVWVLR